jgi:hypothetical protein
MILTIILRLFKNVQKHKFYVFQLYIQYKYFMQTDKCYLRKCAGRAYPHKLASRSVHVSLYWYHLRTKKSCLQSFVLSF